MFQQFHRIVIYSNYIVLYGWRRGGLISWLSLMIYKTRQNTRHMAINVWKYTFSISHKSHHDFVFRMMSPIWSRVNIINDHHLVFWRVGRFRQITISPLQILLPVTNSFVLNFSQIHPLRFICLIRNCLKISRHFIRPI